MCAHVCLHSPRARKGDPPPPQDIWTQVWSESLTNKNMIPRCFKSGSCWVCVCESTLKRKFPCIVVYLWETNSIVATTREPMEKYQKCTYHLGTFSVNGEWLCCGLFAVSGEIRTYRSRTRSAESARPLRVILDSVGYH